MYVIAVGNPFDGLTLYGPYSKSEDSDWAADYFSGETWWIMDLKEIP